MTRHERWFEEMPDWPFVVIPALMVVALYLVVLL
jgi:hypothetical protein